jgi:hypothetical protein
MNLLYSLYALSITGSLGDVYIHDPRGSNDR